MATRRPIGKKTRFEVFKRDRFTCQYCGESAPTVILQVDHIDPVANGGDNNILNLITACSACNGGKGARPLNDEAELAKQHARLVEMQERRDQIQMMSEWRAALKKARDDDANIAIEAFNAEIVGRRLNERGEATIKTILRRFDIISVLDAIEIAAVRYLRTDSDGMTSARSTSDALKKLGGICYNRKKENRGA